MERVAKRLSDGDGHGLGRSGWVLGGLAIAAALTSCGFFGNSLEKSKRAMIASATTEAAKAQLEATEAETLYIMAYSSCPLLKEGQTVAALSQTYAAPQGGGPEVVDFFTAVVTVANTTVCPGDFEGW
ncbi:MAG: hypothetical protein O3C67_07840 [Cyanobacteria bacterium]|nr:hypothetical protein [Cyanobacteriota bacterium]